MLHRYEQPLQGDRFLEKVEGADARRLDCGLDSAVARHHDHRHGELAARGPFLEQSDAVGIGHPDIEQHQIRALPLALPPRFAGAVRQRNLVPLVGQDFREQLADADFVVHYEDVSHRLRSPYAAFARGRSTLTEAPLLGWFSIAMLP